MKYNVVKNKVENRGYGYNDDGSVIEFFDKESNWPIVSISKLKQFVVSTAFLAFLSLNDIEQKIIGNLAFELASTPLEEREEEKRYRLKANLPQLQMSNIYLCAYNDSFVLTNTLTFSPAKTIFTESELEEIDETGFIREEVTE